MHISFPFYYSYCIVLEVPSRGTQKQPWIFIFTACYLAPGEDFFPCFQTKRVGPGKDLTPGFGDQFISES